MTKSTKTTTVISKATAVAKAAPAVGKVAKPKTEVTAKVKAVKVAKEPKAVKVKAVKEVKPVVKSNKAKFIEAYAQGGTRKEVRARTVDLVASVAGFNTYFQNCKSGKAGWTVDAVAK